MKTTLIVANLLALCIGIGLMVYKHQPVESFVPAQEEKSPLRQEPARTISNATPGYLTYDKTVSQLKEWNAEMPELTSFGVYGKTTMGKDCCYLRVGNGKSVVLVTACIHGNEPLASSTVMWYIGALLSGYGKDEAITYLLDSREVYFVPIVSPDSYPSSRVVDGVDPNRDFPGPSRPKHKSCPPVRAIQDLYSKIKPAAVMSGHTWGRVYLTPYGDKMQNCPDHAAIMSVMDKMKSLSGYRCIRACDMYGPNLNNPPIRTLGFGESTPIIGTEVDWYYRGGSFGIVCEFGSHQRIPNLEETKTEFDKTFGAFLYFLKEAPLVKITQ